MHPPAKESDSGALDAGAASDAGGNVDAGLPDTPWAPCDPAVGCGPSYTCSQTGATQFNCFPDNPRFCPIPPGTPVPDGGLTRSDGPLFRNIVGTCSVLWQRPMFLAGQKTLNGSLMRTKDLDGDGVPDLASTRTDLAGLSSILYLSALDGGDLVETPLPPDWQQAWLLYPGERLGGAIVAKGVSGASAGVDAGGSSGSGNPPTLHFAAFAPGQPSPLWGLDGPSNDPNFAWAVWGARTPGGGPVRVAVGSGGIDFDAGSVELFAFPGGAPLGALPTPVQATFDFGGGLVDLALADGGGLFVVGDAAAAGFAGAIRAFDATSLAPVWEVDGDQGAELMGDTLCVPGDLNGDGSDDLVLGIYNYNQGQGRVTALDGQTHQELWHVDGTRPNEAFGNVVTAAGDLDGDGVADLLVSAPVNPYSAPCGMGGRVVVLSGKTGAVLLEIDELTPWNWVGAGLGRDARAIRVVSPGTVELAVDAPAAEWTSDVWAAKPSGVVLGLRCTVP